ncbi:class I SAM-dependent methyltransferase [Nocardiopsis gilva]|uniref:class I SAM-dependent methyltransferase n=1 Tax=Nocardiopsis gilva TaxID=280236 RepID=UPI000347AFFE|nr:class I SAM-dependent methyltransferase [Nocardiopsis gilva]
MSDRTNPNSPPPPPAEGPDGPRVSREWWERSADAYQAEHAAFLRDAFIWCPEGVDEAAAGLLGAPSDLANARVLEVGCGAARASRWLRRQGVARVVGVDVAHRQLQHALRIGTSDGPKRVPVAQADALRLPFADASFDVVFSAFGGFPFFSDAAAPLAESARVLRPGGRLVFAVRHPLSWCFASPSRELTATVPYFDRRAPAPGDNGTSPELHHTMGDWVRALTASGLRLLDVLEPEWRAGRAKVWDGWGADQGRIVPGTAIFAAQREQPAEAG